MNYDKYLQLNLGSLAREYYVMQIDGKSHPMLVDAERMLELDEEFATFCREAFYECEDDAASINQYEVTYS